jgi:integrase
MKLRLTDIAVKKISNPDMGQVTYWDETTPGFGLRCSSKSKSFVVMYGDKRRLKTLGRYPAMSLSDARTEAKRFFVQYTDEPQVFEEPSILFQKAKEQFLQDSALRNKPRTVADYTRLLNKHFSFEANLDEINRQKIMKVISGLAGTPSEQSHAYVAIRTMMNWCVRHGLIETSVVPFLKHGTAARERVLSEGELVKVYMHARDFPYPFRQIIQLAILTGQRRGEIGLLRRSWIMGDEITFPEGFAKNKREHRFPLSPMAQRVIDNLPDTGDLLFPSANNTTKPFTGWAWHKARFDEGLEGVDHYTLHDLRRTFATVHAKIGTPIHVTEKLLNHVSGTISGVAAVYNRHSYMDEMRTAVSAYDEYLENLISP